MSDDEQLVRFRQALNEIDRFLDPLIKLRDLSKGVLETHEITLREKCEHIARLEGALESRTRERDEILNSQKFVKGHEDLLDVIDVLVGERSEDEIRDLIRGIRARLRTEPNMTLEQLRYSSNYLSV